MLQSVWVILELMVRLHLPSFRAVFWLEALGVGYFFRISLNPKQLPGFAWAAAYTPTPQSSISSGWLLPAFLEYRRVELLQTGVQSG